MTKNKYQEPTNTEREEIKSRIYLEFDGTHKTEIKSLDALEYERLRNEYVELNFKKELYKKQNDMDRKI